MSTLGWIVVGSIGLLVLLAIALAVSGVAGVIVAMVAGLYHGFFRPDRPPGENDANWTPDQGSEVE